MTRRLAPARLVAELQRKTVAHAYGDTATILVDTVTSLDSYGQPVVTTASTNIACSFSDKPNMENWQEYADIENIAAEIRFASPAPARGNRVTLKGRFDGSGYVDQTFEIVDIRNRDAFGYVCALKAVQI